MGLSYASLCTVLKLQRASCHIVSVIAVTYDGFDVLRRQGSQVRILSGAPEIEGVNRSHGLHLIPDTWLTLCPVRMVSTVPGRAGFGLRRDASAFPGERERFTRLNDEGSGRLRPLVTWICRHPPLIGLISARSDGFAPDIMAPYTHYPPATTLAAWRNGHHAAFTSNAVDWPEMSRVTHSGREGELANCLSNRYGRNCDRRGLLQEDRKDTEECH